MESDLFRKEAVENRRHSLWGDTLLIQPIAFKFLTMIVLIIVVSLTIFLLFNDVSRKETVRGYLVPDKGMVKVYAPRTGAFGEVFIAEGDEVVKGQVLFVVNTEQRTESGEVNQLVVQELANQQARLVEQVDLQRKQQRERETQLRERIAGVNEELSKLDQQMALQEGLLELQNSKRDRFSVLLAKEWVAEAEMTRLQEESLRQRQKQQELEVLIIRRRQELQKFQHEQHELPLQIAQRIAELESSISSLQQRRIETSARSRYTVHAPVSGRVTYLSAGEGKAAIQQLPALAILPEGVLLRAELYVPTRAVGFVEPGMAVKLRYDAYPYQRFGSYDGEVTALSKTILGPREIAAPIQVEEPVYRVTVALNSQEVRAYGKELALQSGLTLEADVILERRSLFEWLLEPLYSLKGRV